MWFEWLKKHHDLDINQINKKYYDLYQLQVDWAEPEHEVDEETMSTVKVAALHLPKQLIQNRLKKLYYQ